MPLPWKKTKVLKMSRLMADPRHGGSLVVETGFPTSLVDLFVKYRDRLKKQSKKKSQSEPQMEILRPMNATPPPTPYHSTWQMNSSSGGEENVQRNVFNSAPVEELVVVEECAVDDRGVGVADGEVDGDGSKKRPVFLAFLKVFLIVILVFCSKKLTIGITKSAFLLLFLEFVGTQSKARTVFDCFVGRVKFLCFCKCKKNEEEIKSCEKDSTRGFNDGSVCDSAAEEIEVVESKCVVVTPIEEIESERENLKIESGDRRVRCLDLEKKERILDENENKNRDKVDAYVYKKGQSRRAKVRAHFKKIFPKKLYKKKEKKCKEDVNSSTEVCYFAVGDKFSEKRSGDIQEQHGEEELSPSSSVQEEESCKGEGFDESQAEAKVIVAEEPVERERKANSSYLILCLIVLSGLFGGRVVALVLTVCWCLILKLDGKLRSVTISS